ncbi:MAG: glucokinase [Candidatus Hydrogenedentota bacterium]
MIVRLHGEGIPGNELKYDQMTHTQNEYVIGLEIGGTKLQAVLGTRDGRILHTERGVAPVQDGAHAILSWFKEPVARLIAHATGEGKRVASIGVGFGGPVESNAGKVMVSHQVSGWDNFPMRTWLEEAFGLPVYLGNDSNVAGWAEYRIGAGVGTRQFCYMNIGSGIGGALVINGILHDGQGLGAAEIGHTLVPDWTNPVLGSANKLENLCSGWSIEKRLRAHPLAAGTPLHTLAHGDAQIITCAMLGEAARQGDAAALAELDRVGHAAGIALANVITLVHPERIAMGGGVSLLGDVLLNPIRKYAAHYVFGCYRGKYEIVPCALGEAVVVAGALLLAPETDE